MGRRYSGDIENKSFKFELGGDPSFFGGTECEPNTIEYEFLEEDVPDIESGIDKCVDALGKYKALMDAAPAVDDFTGQKELLEALGLKAPEAFKVLNWYAQLELGQRILACIKSKGFCLFEVNY